MMPDSLITAAYFAHTRWRLDFRDATLLQTWQHRQIKRFLSNVLPRAPYFAGRRYTHLSEIPIMDKAAMMADFDRRNTRGVRLDQAMPIGLKAEQTRDFRPELGDLTVGLSSGTSGNRGVFLVSREERLRWAGIMLGRAMPRHLLGRLLTPWQPPLRIAFFLRANSNLYDTLNSRRISFTFHDLLKGVDAALPMLNAIQPDVLVGPPALLRDLATSAQQGRLAIQPDHIISVADVLEEEDKTAIRNAFGRRPHQLYQATEGFLGYTCEYGTIHLNESYVHVEPEWLDAERTRFQPIVTDFTRNTQLIVRYRLNDILHPLPTPCPCGRAELGISAIEGRSDEVLLLPSKQTGQSIAVYPDLIRRALLLAGPAIREFSIVQKEMTLHVGLLTDTGADDVYQRVLSELGALWESLNVTAPHVHFCGWKPPAPGAKRRRIHRHQAPQGLRCTY